MNHTFPKDFLWGASTAAAQIEGAWNEGGRTPSIWDVAPGDKIKNGESCHIACDHFHRFKEDIALMKKIGLNSYRFSLSWSRIISEDGVINENGIRFYNELIDELITNGIEPLVTLYHWDLPLWSYKKGGWLDKRIINDFTFYTETVVKALSDRVQYWITFNEPQCFLMNGYMQGVHAPFKRNYFALPKFTKYFMMANKQAVDIIRRKAIKKPLIGLSFATGAFIPEDETNPESVEKARYRSFYDGMGVMNNRWFMDPILLGKTVQAYGIFKTHKRDMKNIKTDLDFIAVNNYEAFNYAVWGGDKHLDKTALPQSMLGWVIDGRSMYWTLKFLYERYHLPLLISENGVALKDTVKDGVIDDKARADYLDEYLFNVKRAIKEGIPVKGYEHWSLMDNFEWAEGYEPRFGLIYVDYKTQERTLKNSAYHYKKIIETNGDIL